MSPIKSVCLVLTLGACLATPILAQATTSAPPAAKTPAPKTGALTKDEVAELNKARAAALKANPDLVAERKELDDKNKAWSKKVDEAAAKVDPNVAAILAKRDAAKPKTLAPTKPKPPTAAAKPKPVTTPSTNAPSTNAPASTPPPTN